LVYYSRCKNTGAIATAGGDDNIRIFVQEVTSDPDQPTFTLRETVHKAHLQDVNAVAWNTKHPGLLASCSDEGDIKLWKFEMDS
jgi:WD40 repeat protein